MLAAACSRSVIPKAASLLALFERVQARGLPLVACATKTEYHRRAPEAHLLAGGRVGFLQTARQWARLPAEFVAVPIRRGFDRQLGGFSPRIGIRICRGFRKAAESAARPSAAYLNLWQNLTAPKIGRACRLAVCLEGRLSSRPSPAAGKPPLRQRPAVRHYRQSGAAPERPPVPAIFLRGVAVVCVVPVPRSLGWWNW